MLDALLAASFPQFPRVLLLQVLPCQLPGIRRLCILLLLPCCRLMPLALTLSPLSGSRLFTSL